MTSFSGRIADAAAGPIGSKEWAASRWERFNGVDHALTPAEHARMAELMASDLAKSKHQLAPKPALLLFGDLTISDSGKLERVPDFDDTTPLAPVDAQKEVKFRNEAERVFRSLCEDETGVVVDAALKRKKDAENALVRRQSHDIASKLEQAGVIAYRNGEWQLATVGVHSGEFDVLPNFRRIAFLPYIAGKIREPFVRALEYFLQMHQWARFWTLTGGPRVRLKDLRHAIRTLTKRINRLNKQDFMHEAGVRIVFRSTELGTVEKSREDVLENIAGAIERDEKGELWFHPHAHCLVYLENGRLTKSQWSAFLVRLRAYWGDWMDDGGCIRSVREAVKYVTKPSEIEHLTPEATALHQYEFLKKRKHHPVEILRYSAKEILNGVTL